MQWDDNAFGEPEKKLSQQTQNEKEENPTVEKLPDLELVAFEECKDNKSDDGDLLETSNKVENDSDTLKSINKQLIELSNSVHELKENVSEIQQTDVYTVIEKIESTRDLIVKLLAPCGMQQKDGAEKEPYSISMLIQAIVSKLEKNDRMLKQYIKENATFQFQVRENMQKEYNDMQIQLRGEHFNPLLKEIATVYVEYQSLFGDESISEQSRKNLNALFDQLKDLLSDYGAEVISSKEGSKRQRNTCKIINKVPTGDKEMHDTIVLSRKPGVVRGRTVLYHEYVDIYVYDKSLGNNEISNEAIEDDKTNSELEDITGYSKETNVFSDGNTSTDINDLGGNVQ